MRNAISRDFPQGLTLERDKAPEKKTIKGLSLVCQTEAVPALGLADTNISETRFCVAPIHIFAALISVNSVFLMKSFFTRRVSIIDKIVTIVRIPINIIY